MYALLHFFLCIFVCSPLGPRKPWIILSFSHLTSPFSSPAFSPQHAVVQSGLARWVRLPAGWDRTQLHPVCGGGQQCTPGGAAGRGPGPGDWGSQCVYTGSSGCHCHRPDSEEHPSQYRSGVPHTAGLTAFESITEAMHASSHIVLIFRFISFFFFLLSTSTMFNVFFLIVSSAAAPSFILFFVPVSLKKIPICSDWSAPIGLRKHQRPLFQISSADVLPPWLCWGCGLGHRLLYHRDLLYIQKSNGNIFLQYGIFNVCRITHHITVAMYWEWLWGVLWLTWNSYLFFLPYRWTLYRVRMVVTGSPS